MAVDEYILQERLNKLFRKDAKIITSADINELYKGLSKEQKKLVDRKFRSFLFSKVKEDRIEKIEKEKKEKIEATEKEIKERKKYFKEHKICESVQKVADKVKDPRSIFKDIGFIEEVTGCKIKPKRKRKPSKIRKS